MYLYLGADQLVPLRDVVAVLDERATRAPATREFLDVQRAEGRLHDLAADHPRAVVVADRGTYLSPFAAATLWRRVR
ncbi:MAG TPA: hypothetical protein VF282_10175, partial [Bacillota bacterium]